MHKNKLFSLGLLAVALTFGLVLVGCGGNEETPSGPSYIVAISPATVSKAPGATQYFEATRKQDGAIVNGSETWSVTGASSSSTRFGSGYEDSLLTIASGETATSLTVKATITYSGASYEGTATVTVISAEDVAAALEAISDAANADALLTALKAPNAGIDQRYVIDANKAAYWAYAQSSGFSSPSADSIQWALQYINGTVLLTAFNGATSAAAVQALLTEATFLALDIEDVWSQYNGLSANGKTAVATAVYNGGTDYDSYNNYGYGNGLTSAIEDAVYEQFVMEALPALTPKLDAAIATGATLAQIQALMNAVCDLWGMDTVTVHEVNLAEIKAEIAADQYITAYKNATGDAKTAAAEYALVSVFSIVMEAEGYYGSN
jgi:hypothetical protein